ncbi:hypothetical protein EIN_355590 [Entamoeba invadens IP1]|uniref:DUF4371 domain-containing protein n=1 Tax=Entamoeba invadens IP1 TaxID=370355 RepID=L7FN28_ENTIV|nr:hypothetical protein EIN_355590 [Entamoeba invadens IP1]ELP92538.1 hypothetical protein EIN_355590 [Entamoeba invadens IP1]|eukprot:XP_004259309.1 hypothetical protein EIN_355590 [Entamoeba invadens IP1]
MVPTGVGERLMFQLAEMSNEVSLDNINTVLLELGLFENGAFKEYKDCGMENVDIDEASETVRKFSYDKHGDFSLERFIVAFDCLFDEINTITNKKRLFAMEVRQRKITDYVINSITNESLMSERQKKAVKTCILISHAALSRETLSRSKTLAISQRTSVNQIKETNKVLMSTIRDERELHDCLAISVDSTTKDDVEIFCVMLRLIKGRNCYSMPLLLRQYKGELDAETLAKWLVSKLTDLGLICHRIVNVTSDGIASWSGLNGSVPIKMNELVQKELPLGRELIDSDIKQFWCSAHRLALCGEGLEKEPEIFLVKVFIKWFCKKSRLNDYNTKCGLNHDINSTYSFTRWFWISRNITEIINNYENVVNYVSTPSVYEELSIELASNKFTFFEDKIKLSKQKKNRQFRHEQQRQEMLGSDDAEEEDSDEARQVPFNLNSPPIRNVFYKSKKIFELLFIMCSSLQEDSLLLFECVECVDMMAHGSFSEI